MLAAAVAIAAVASAGSVAGLQAAGAARLAGAAHRVTLLAATSLAARGLAARGLAATGLAAPGSRPGRKPVWRTCTPLDARLVGPYRVYNDAWASRECISSTGPNLRVLTRAQPSGGDVVAYPNIQYGAAYGYTTPGSGLPVRLSRMGHPLFTATAAGAARGSWIADFDSWFFSGSDTSSHGTTEMIIVLRYMPGMAHGVLIRIGRVHWWLREAQTCNSGLCWPLIRYFAARQTRHVRHLPMRAFVRIAVHHRMLTASDWWGSTAFGFELWSGGRGLAAAMTVRHPPAGHPGRAPAGFAAAQQLEQLAGRGS